MLKKKSKIYIAGHNGLVGSSVHNLLLRHDYKNLLYKRRKELDLTDEKKVDIFFKRNKPRYLIICAAKVGGILNNQNYPLEFLLENFLIEKNLLIAAKKYNIERTIFLGSSCIYPKKSKTPIKESYLMSGKLEKTNESYALSKIMGIKLSEILFCLLLFISYVVEYEVFHLAKFFERLNFSSSLSILSETNSFAIELCLAE